MMNADNTKIWAQKQKERQQVLRNNDGEKFINLSKQNVYLLLAGFGIILPLIVFGVYFFNQNAGGSEPEVNGNTITVKQGGNFQAALDRAKSGDTILLEAGATFKGNFKLPNKTGNAFVTIRTSAPDSQFAAADARLDPQKYASPMPKLFGLTKGEPVILTADGAHHYRFIGIEFGNTVEGLNTIIQLGSTEEKRVEDLPHHIEFDRVYIHGHPADGQRRGIAANGRNIIVKNSYISDIKRKGDESQAIAVWATDGPVEITNNYLEGASENVLFGGAGSVLKLVPTNCVVRDNWLNKPLNWRAEGWGVKNIFEIKNGRNIKVENNLMTNNWASGQDGTAILFTVREDNGKESLIEDIEFSGNIVRSSGSAISIYGSEGSGGKNLTIRNNIFDDIDGAKYGGAGIFLKATDWNGLTIENNTIFQQGNITLAYGTPIRGFVFRNNIILEKGYGIAGADAAPGRDALNRFFPRAAFSNNIIVGGSAAAYPGTNFFPNSIRQIGFVNSEMKDYRLKSDSPFLTKGSAGNPIGANLIPQITGGK